MGKAIQLPLTSFECEKGQMRRIEHEGMPIVGLFCGAGGLDEGFRQAGFRTVFAADHAKAACETFKRNHPRATVMNWDLSVIPANEIVRQVRIHASSGLPIGVVGGPPCQAFSMSNVHKSADDPRAKLPENYARIVGALREEFGIHFFVFENVFGLKHKRHAEQLAALRKLFRKAGFRIFEAELDAQEFGAPQMRRRLFIVGLDEDRYGQLGFKFPEGDGQRRTVRETISNLPEPVFFRKGLSTSEIPFHPNHWTMQPKSAKFSSGELSPGKIKGRPFRVLSWDSPSWTVAYGHREVHVHPNCTRRLSVYEAMLLQTFPTDYELAGTLSQQITLVSDAVPPSLAKALAESIGKVLKLDQDDYASLDLARISESTALDFAGV